MHVPVWTDGPRGACAARGHGSRRARREARSAWQAPARCRPSVKGSPTPPKVGVLKVPNVFSVHLTGSGAMSPAGGGWQATRQRGERPKRKPSKALEQPRKAERSL